MKATAAQKVKEVLHSWEERLNAQARAYANFAEQIVGVDKEMIMASLTLMDVTAMTETLKAQQELADTQVDEVLEEQRNLTNLISSLEKDIQDRRATVAPSGGTGGRAGGWKAEDARVPVSEDLGRRAAHLAEHLQELDRQLYCLTQEANTVQENALPIQTPMGSLIRTLDLQQEALKRMKEKAGILEDHLQAKERRM